ncbi:hypothetical protein KY310_03720 [Candidatus Woesearchaeota archaeon]|nr:hypothetical protein [Candidatus Woesearchaeota archaeon]
MKKSLVILLFFLLVSCSPEFPEVMTGGFREPLAPCRDTDGGAVFDVYGRAIDYYVIRYDHCGGDVLYEAVCANFQQSAYLVHECENGCLNGVCKQKSIKYS